MSGLEAATANKVQRVNMSRVLRRLACLRFRFFYAKTLSERWSADFDGGPMISSSRL